MSQNFVVEVFYNACYVAHAAVADFDIASVENVAKRMSCAEILVDELQEGFSNVR